jgi:hypothetical protein
MTPPDDWEVFFYKREASATTAENRQAVIGRMMSAMEIFVRRDSAVKLN